MVIPYSKRIDVVMHPDHFHTGIVRAPLGPQWVAGTAVNLVAPTLGAIGSELAGPIRIPVRRQLFIIYRISTEVRDIHRRSNSDLAQVAGAFHQAGGSLEPRQGG